MALRVLSALGSIALASIAVPVRAAGDAPSPADAPVVDTPPAIDGAPAQEAAPKNEATEAEGAAELRAQLERQAAAIEALKRAEAQHERREAEREQRELERARASIVRFSGYLQVDWVPYDQASVDEVNASSRTPLNQERFTLRRGHLRADAERGLVSGALELDANTTNGPQVRPIDAEISLHALRGDRTWPSVVLTAGLFKIPFGFEVQELDVDRPFLERSSVARALFPGEFDLGARVWASYRFLDAKVALMNGHPIGDSVFPALDPASAKEVVGRIGVRAELVPGVVLDVGASAERGMGFHEGTPTTKDQLTWRDDNGDGLVQATEIQVIPGSAGTASELFRRFGVGADARLAVAFARGFGCELRAEVMRAENLDRGLEPADPVGAGYDLRELGYYVGVTQELTAFGLVGIRYDRYNPDQDAREEQALSVVPRDRSYSTLALLAMLRYDDARLSFEYDRNGNALGRTANGTPTTLASDTATVRAQFRF